VQNTRVQVTHIGGPTALIEFDGWRILTDPTFDPPGRRYGFGFGTSSVKTRGPAIAREDLGRIDAVVLSHDQHADNLDDAGRELLAEVPVVVTTRAARRRLGGDNVVGLDAWQTTTIENAEGGRLDITATPCRHGPPLSGPIVGDVIGFALRWDGQKHGQLWISGDTVLFAGIHEVADRLRIGTALLHLGGVQFPITGPLRYTMTARDAVELCQAIRPHTVIPVHYEGWRHFRQNREAAEREFAAAAGDIHRSIRWLERGVSTEIPA
jgi:L-ascorbate metabolism protein UlaG (beta-lactamase superfamily)